MRRILLLALAGSLLYVSAAWANFGPPYLPKDRKNIDPAVRLDGIDKNPEYVFHVHFGGTYLGEKLIEVKDAKTFTLNVNAKQSDRVRAVSYMTLLALERKEFDQRAKEDPSLKWLTEKAKGALSAKLSPPETTAPINAKDVPVTTYRVTITEGKLTAEKVEHKKGAEAPLDGLLPSWAFGIVSSLSMAWLGLWFARRGGAPKSPLH